MSASTERKNRIAAKADGTHKKTNAARKEAEKQKKDKIKWTVITVLIVVFLGAVIFMNTGAFYRTATAVSVDIDAYEADGVSVPAQTVNFSVAEVNYVFNSNYSNFMNSYGSFAAYLGLDSSLPLDSQPCSMSGDTSGDYTWYDYFMDATLSQLENYAATKAYAEAAGIELSDEDMAEIDQTVKDLASGAEEGGYSMNKYLSTVYGKGCNEKVFRDILGMEYLSMAVRNSVTDANEYTAEEISAHYAEIADDYDFYGYSYYFVAAETALAEDGQSTLPPTEEAMAEAKATAESIMRAIRAGDLEGAIISVLGEEVVPQHNEAVEGEAEEGHVHTASTTVADVQGIQLEVELAEWLQSENRQAGETDVVEAAEAGYYVVIFNDRHTETEPTEESDGVPYCDFIAEEDLRNEDFNTWNTGFFTGLMEGIESSIRFGARFLG